MGIEDLVLLLVFVFINKYKLSVCHEAQPDL